MNHFSLFLVLTFCSLSKDEITDERVCTLARELQVNQSHQKLEWVQPFMCNILRGVCWDCTVIPIPVHWKCYSMHGDTCKPCPIHAWIIVHIPNLWSRSNKNLLSVANSSTTRMYQSIFCWITMIMNLCWLVFDSLLYTVVQIIVRIWVRVFLKSIKGLPMVIHSNRNA